MVNLSVYDRGSDVSTEQRTCGNCILREAVLYCPRKGSKERTGDSCCEKWDGGRPNVQAG